MILIPSLDIIDGKTVRLHKGDFKQTTFYQSTPLDIAKSYIDFGYTFMHIVNLDSVIGNDNIHTKKTIEQICKLNNIRIQMGGGLRNNQDIEQANNIGVSQFVVGTIAVNNIELTKSLMNQYGKERFTLALDVLKQQQDYIIQTHGWTENSKCSLFELIKQYDTYITHLLCTDIDKDGALNSPNFDLYEHIKKTFPSIFLQASGGIHDKNDLHQLDNLKVDGVVVGKAIHEGLLDLKKLNDFFGK